MSFSVHLKRLDGSDTQYQVVIPDGKTVIGRGPVLKCSDSKVSRNHAVIEVSCEDHTAVLTPMHVNPCFYKAKGSNKYKTLEKGEEQRLSNGDVIKILPEEFEYEVEIKDEVKSDDVGDDSDATECSEVEDQEVEEPRSVNSQKDQSPKKPSPKKISDDVNNGSTVARKRILPEWLIQAANGKKTEDSETKKRKPSTSKTKVIKTAVRNKQNTKEEDDLSDEDEPVTKKKVVKKDSGKRAESKTRDDDSSEEEPVEKKKEFKKTEKVSAKKAEDKTDSQETKKKKKCPYGSSCYRKNPVHFEEFTHDDNASEDDEENDDEKPECEYGLDCYRQNKQHRIDFKHTKRVRQAAKKTKTKLKESDDDDDETDDSFVVDDDSDEYVPGRGGSDTEEDIDELVKDAEKFKRNKKFLRP